MCVSGADDRGISSHFPQSSLTSDLQNLEFIAETRILAEMKFENCGKKFSVERKLTSILLSYEN